MLYKVFLAPLRLRVDKLDPYPLNFKRRSLNFLLIKLPRREMTREHCLRDNIRRFGIADDP